MKGRFRPKQARGSLTGFRPTMSSGSDKHPQVERFFDMAEVDKVRVYDIEKVTGRINYKVVIHSVVHIRLELHVWPNYEAHNPEGVLILQAKNKFFLL